uniref:histidine kinase n=1 Tax=Palpitomonas bilix TaxID=652834 RepID=A0A7S3D419_9EUKA
MPDASRPEEPWWLDEKWSGAMRAATLRLFSDGCIGCVLVTNKQRLLLNAEMTRICGYTQDEVPTLYDWFEKLYSPHHETVIEFYNSEFDNEFRLQGKARENAAPGEIYARRIVQMRRKDGDTRYCQFSCMRVYPTTESTDVEHAIAVWIIADIDSQTKKTVSFEHQLNITKMTLNTLREAILWMGPEGIVEDCNEGVQKLAKGKGKALVGMHVSEALPSLTVQSSETGHFCPFDVQVLLDDVMTRVKSASTKKKWENADFSALRKAYLSDGEGNRAPVMIKLVPALHGSGGSVDMENIMEFGSAGIGTTIVKFGENSLHGFVLSIEDLSAAEQVLDAEKRAKERSLFLSVMSHEIRTPLNGIVGIVEELDSQAEHLPEIREHTETLRCSSDTLLTLVNNILDFSKLDSGAMELTMSSVVLSEEVGRLIRTFDGQARKAGLKLSFACTGLDISGVEFLVDWRKLMQVLMNLVSNALKFTPRVTPSGSKGHVSLTLEVGSTSSVSLPPPTASTSERCEGGDNQSSYRLTFAVRDNGIGIEPSKQSRVFEVFRQADASIHSSYGGTGLGLSITKRLVELMGSSIRLESAVGEGSCFSFSITLDGRNVRVEGDAQQAGHSKANIDLSTAGVVAPAIPVSLLNEGGGNRDLNGGLSTAEIAPVLPAVSTSSVPVRMPAGDVSAGLPSASQIEAEPIPSRDGSMDDVEENAASASFAGSTVSVSAAVNHPQSSVDAVGSGVSSRAPWEPLQALRIQKEGMLIAVVDDDPVNVKVAKLTLKRMGYAGFSTFNDGTHLVAAYQTMLANQVFNLLSTFTLEERRSMVSSGKCPVLGFSFILMDLHMPTMEGTTATRHCFSYHARALLLLSSFDSSQGGRMTEEEVKSYLLDDDTLSLFISAQDVISCFCSATRAHCPSLLPSTISTFLSLCPRVLGASADVELSVQRRCLSSGMLRFVGKPCTKVVLERALTGLVLQVDEV